MLRLTALPILLLIACNPLAGSDILGRWTMHIDTRPADGPLFDMELILSDDGSARLTRIEDWSSGCLDAFQLDGTFTLPATAQVRFVYTGGWSVASDACMGGAWHGDPPAAELEWRSATHSWSVSEFELTLGDPGPSAVYIRN